MADSVALWAREVAPGDQLELLGCWLEVEQVERRFEDTGGSAPSVRITFLDSMTLSLHVDTLIPVRRPRRFALVDPVLMAAGGRPASRPPASPPFSRPPGC